MNKQEIICASCEAEFYIESDSEVYFCPHCGSDIDQMDDDWDGEGDELDDDI